MDTKLRRRQRWIQSYCMLILFQISENEVGRGISGRASALPNAIDALFQTPTQHRLFSVLCMYSYTDKTNTDWLLAPTRNESF